MNDIRTGTEPSWYDTTDIDLVHDLLTDAGATSIWVKRLVPNNNSKQQVYLGADPSDLSFLPLGTPSYTPTKSRKRKAGAPVIQIPVPWIWVTPQGQFDAPDTRLCYYPQYPEVRLSGFLRGCGSGPSELMSETRRGHEDGRCLFFGPTKTGTTRTAHVVGLVVGSAAPAARYVLGMDGFARGQVCPVPFEKRPEPGDFSALEHALLNLVGKRIIPWRLRNDGSIQKPYTAPNAPGFTLEAELGVGENAIPGPDFDVWELKAVKQNSLEQRQNHKVTLFTPQPDRGWIMEHNQAEFVLRYGHVQARDDDGNPTSYYFTTKDFNRPDEHKASARLDMMLTGFTDERHFDPEGMIALADAETGDLIAGWSYLKLLEHWQRKHNRAAYVPYLRDDSGNSTHVEFGPLVTLGISTSFGLLLQAFKEGKVVYDPGDKASLMDGGWRAHPRSQFRINLKDIGTIYKEVKRVDIRNAEAEQHTATPQIRPGH